MCIWIFHMSNGGHFSRPQCVRYWTINIFCLLFSRWVERRYTNSQYVGCKYVSCSHHMETLAYRFTGPFERNPPVIAGSLKQESIGAFPSLKASYAEIWGVICEPGALLQSQIAGDLRRHGDCVTSWSFIFKCWLHHTHWIIFIRMFILIYIISPQWNSTYCYFPPQRRKAKFTYSIALLLMTWWCKELYY